MKAKILIVDNSVKDCTTIGSMLSDFNVLTACDGLEAMKQIEKNRDIDLIILDLNVPNTDGFQVLKELKYNAGYNKLSTIVLSDSDEIDGEIKALKLGAVDYIRKPVNFESLRARLEIHLKLKRSQRKIEQDIRMLDSMVLKKNADLYAISEKLKESELMFRTIFDQAPIGIAIGNNDKFIILDSDEISSINPMFEKITGRSRKELASISWTDITHPDDLPEDLENFKKFKSGKIDGYDMEKRYIRPDGSSVWVHMIITTLKLNNSINSNHLCLIEDISKRKTMEEVLYESERSKTVFLSNLPGMAYRCNYDRDWTMQFVSEGCFDLTGYKAESLLFNKDLCFNDIIASEYQESIWLEWERILALRIPFRYRYEIISAVGVRKWVLEMGQGIYDAAGNVEALEGIIIDISKEKERELHIQYLNEHDYLTGLYNRRYFEEILTRDSNINHKEKRAVLLVNLKRFNHINSIFGYQFGENLIRELANNLSAHCTEKCQLFQISIDRFAFYIKDYLDKNELREFCDSIIDSLYSSLSLKTIVGGSIGIVEINNGIGDAGSILKNASIAVENASNNQIFGYSFFDSEMESKAMREADIKDELTKISLDEYNDSLYLQYQPVLDLRTNKISGFEALARLRSKKLGNVSPMEFIPIAEETQLIVPLGKRIMRLAFRFLKELETKGFDNMRMSFNLSAIQLLRDDLIPDLTEVIDETKIDPSNLCIEITESIFSDDFQEINRKLDIIKALGIKIAIDDFGTGYSSLARERELNVDCMKIDKYFIDKLLSIDAKEAITGNIISIAHKLGHFVIAEGVENEKQKQYLKENNCDYMQGYLFSKPLDQNSAIELLEITNRDR